MRNIYIKAIFCIFFLLNSKNGAFSQNFHVVEIDSMEYNNAKCGFEKTFQYLSPTPVYNFKEEENEFLYRIVNQDDKAREIYIEEIISDGYFNHEFFCSHDYEGIIKPLLFLEFETPLESFTYISSIKPRKYMASQNLSVSDIRINSTPIVVSSDGYIAGFKDNNDAYYVDFKIYKMDLEENGELSINQLFAYESKDSRDWRTSNYPFSIFWKNGALYISGYALEYEAEKHSSPGLLEVPCYYKVEIE